MSDTYLGNNARLTLAALALAASAGCSAAGHRDDIYRNNPGAESTGRNYCSEARNELYGLGGLDRRENSIDVLSARAASMLTVEGRANYFATHKISEILRPAFDGSARYQAYRLTEVDVTKSPDKIAQMRATRAHEETLHDALRTEYLALTRLLFGALLDRYLFAKAQAQTNFSFDVRMTDEEQKIVAGLLSGLEPKLLTLAQMTELKAKSESDSSLERDLAFIEAARKYVRSDIAGLADLHALEAEIPEMAQSYALIDRLNGRDSRFVGTNARVVNAMHQPITLLPDSHPLRERYAAMSLADLNYWLPLDNQLSSFGELTINNAVLIALEEMKITLRRNTYSNRHEAWQNTGWMVATLPFAIEHDSVKLTLSERLVAHRWIIEKMAQIYRDVPPPEINTLDFVLTILPGAGPVYAIATGEVRDAFTPDHFPIAVSGDLSTKQRYQEALTLALKEGERIKFGVGNASHFIGSNTTPQVAIPISVVTTSAAVIGGVAVGFSASGSGAASAPEVPVTVGGGGTIAPGF